MPFPTFDLLYYINVVFLNKQTHSHMVVELLTGKRTLNRQNRNSSSFKYIHIKKKISRPFLLNIFSIKILCECFCQVKELTVTCHKELYIA